MYNTIKQSTGSSQYYGHNISLYELVFTDIRFGTQMHACMVDINTKVTICLDPP